MTLTYPNTTSSSPVTLSSPPARRGILFLYLVVILLPISFEIAGLRLTPLKLFLLVTVIPLFIQTYREVDKGPSWVDIFIFLHVAWVFLALVVAHGVLRIPYAGITAIEVVGGYLLGRLTIRSYADYRWLIQALVIVLVLLLPFAVIELLTGRIVIADALRPFFDTPFRGYSAYGRLGFERVYGTFDHPIMFGLFCSFVFANAWMTLRSASYARVIIMGLAFLMTAMSLSSAPLLAIALQLMVIIWAIVTKGAWKTLIVLAVLGYVMIDASSNRTPVTILIDLATFNPTTGWIRIATFDYGMLSVRANPVFGIGLGDWPRPEWLTSSVDNFWLLTAMRYGLPALAFYCVALALHVLSILRTPLESEEAKSARIGYLIVLGSLVLVLMTVHVWGAVAVFCAFYIGAGSWLCTGETKAAPEKANSEANAQDRTPPRYTRFKSRDPRS